MQEDRETDPNDPQAICYRLAGYVRGLTVFRNAHIEPADTLGVIKMPQGKAGDFLIHIRRVEYCVRCFILFLVTQFLDAKHALPYTPRARTIGEPKTLIEQQEKEAYILQTGKVVLCAFSVLLPVPARLTPSKTRQRKSSRAKKYQLTDPLWPVDIAHLTARIARLARVMTRTDKIAERLAARMQYLETNKAKHDVSGYPSSGPNRCKPSGDSQPHPLYFPPFEHWLPPAHLYESGNDAERGDINFLHYLASSALSKYGVKHTTPDPHILSIPPPAEPNIQLL